MIPLKRDLVEGLRQTVNLIKGNGVENTKITIGMLLHWMHSSLVSVS